MGLWRSVLSRQSNDMQQFLFIKSHILYEDDTDLHLHQTECFLYAVVKLDSLCYLVWTCLNFRAKVCAQLVLISYSSSCIVLFIMNSCYWTWLVDSPWRTIFCIIWEHNFMVAWIVFCTMTCVIGFSKTYDLFLPQSISTKQIFASQKITWMFFTQFCFVVFWELVLQKYILLNNTQWRIFFRFPSFSVMQGFSKPLLLPFFLLSIILLSVYLEIEISISLHLFV